MATLLTGLVGAAHAQDAAPPTLEHCAAIGAASDRLICNDKLAGRAPAPTVPPAKEALPGQPATPPTTSPLVAKDAPTTDR